jgi:hypothetical protein
MQQELDRHRAVLDGYLATARSVAPERWRQPPAPGKWTPAQITDHLIRTYSVLVEELRGAAGVRVVTGRVQRSLLRLLVLPWILRKERLPRGAKAPREIRPGEGDDPEAALAELRRRAEEFEATIAAAGAVQLTHPYFGKLDARTAVRFCAIHTENHRKQL